jgi:hypothetical protein
MRVTTPALGAFVCASVFAGCSGDGDAESSLPPDGGSGLTTGGANNSANGGSANGGSPATSGGAPGGGGQTAGGTGAGGGAEAGGNAGASGGAGASGAGGGTAGSGGTGGSQGSGGQAAGGAPGDAGVVTCGTISTFEDGKTPSRTLHVATNGSSQGDGSQGAPFGSIEQAAAQATPGTSIVIHAGTYAGGDFVTGLSGTANAPIWVGGATGEAKPLFDGGSEAFHFVRARYVVVHDLEVSNTTANGINCDDGDQRANVDASRYLVFRGLDIHDVGGSGNQDCLKLSGLNDYWVLDSAFARCGGAASGSGIDHVGCHNGVIAENRFTDLSGNGVQAKGGSENIEIRRNVMIRAGERAVNLGGSTGFEFFRPPLSTTAPNVEARDIRVIANIIEGGTSAVAFVGCVDCLAAHNTIVAPTNWVARILQETVTGGGYTFLESQGGRFVNNIVVTGSGLRTEVNVGAGTLPATFEFRNNLWYDRDNPSSSTPSLPVSESGSVIGEAPGFAGPSDYTIGSGSRAAGAGETLGDTGGDMDRKCWATPPSIGAFEGN